MVRRDEQRFAPISPPFHVARWPISSLNVSKSARRWTTAKIPSLFTSVSRNSMAQDSRQAGAREITLAEGSALDRATRLLWLCDPEQPHRADYALTIAQAISGHRYSRCDERRSET